MEKQTEPWPVWGRLLFWVVVAVVLAAALVAALRYGGLSATTVRVVVTVVVVPGVALVAVNLVSRRRVATAAARLRAELDTAVEEVTREWGRPVADRASGASEASLRGAVEAVDVARQRLDAGDLPGTGHAVEQLHTATADWTPDAAATTAVAACRRTARRLVRAGDTASRTAR